MVEASALGVDGEVAQLLGVGAVFCEGMPGGVGKPLRAPGPGGVLKEVIGDFVAENLTMGRVVVDQQESGRPVLWPVMSGQFVEGGLRPVVGGVGLGEVAPGCGGEQFGVELGL
jgi:hypothetical protein